MFGGGYSLDPGQILPDSMWFGLLTWNKRNRGVIHTIRRYVDILCVLVLSFPGDIAVNHASFHLGVRDTKW
jgi:hypothetical protein